MKLTPFVALPFMLALSSASAASLRATCEDAPTPTTASPTETPAPTTDKPTPAPLEAPIVFFDANGDTIRTWDGITLDKCISWQGCQRSGDTASIGWESLGPAGTTIAFFRSNKCDGEVFDAFAADAPDSFVSSELPQYRTFVVRSSVDAEVDRSDTFGCQK